MGSKTKNWSFALNLRFIHVSLLLCKEFRKAWVWSLTLNGPKPLNSEVVPGLQCCNGVPSLAEHDGYSELVQGFKRRDEFRGPKKHNKVSRPIFLEWCRDSMRGLF